MASGQAKCMSTNRVSRTRKVCVLLCRGALSRCGVQLAAHLGCSRHAPVQRQAHEKDRQALPTQ
jgi:hypothetical protein